MLLQAIAKQTSIETFTSNNAVEGMNTYLNENLAEERQTNELHNTNSLWYFVLENSTILGYLKLNIGNAQTE